MDTIFALASASGKAGVSIIRISGPKALEVGANICGGQLPIRKSTVRTIIDDSGDYIDQALVLAFQAPNSFTGQNVVELHVHGSVAIIQSILKLLNKFNGLRISEPGEFTRRALENGKLDISQVEGLADLIDAETEAQRKQALRVLSGALSKKTENWRTDLIRAAALLEATIDFADEEVPVDVSPEVSDLLNKVIIDLKTEVDGSHIAERIRTGFEVAIVGEPNAGKSTLLNYLAGREAAITSDIAGTTRDVIEVRMDLNGVPVTILDTAGIRSTQDIVEKIGISKAIERANQADMRIVLTANGSRISGLNTIETDLTFIAKDDDGINNGVSGITGFGVSELIEHIGTVFSKKVLQMGVATRERHRFAMSNALVSLENSINWLSYGPDHYEITSEEVRIAIRQLDGLIGRIDVESVLDEIFSSFCLGK